MSGQKRKIVPMTPGISRAARARAYVVGGVVTLALTGVAWKAWALQVEDGPRYKELAERQHAVTVQIPAPRGDILDTHGRPLAVSADADSIWADPRQIKDVTTVADKLAKLIGADPALLEAKLGGDHRFAWIQRQVSPEIAKQVREAKLPGIEVAKEPRRWYPSRTTGGTVIGRADIDGKGVEGIELSMNAQLVGRHGAGLALRDARGKRMFAEGMAQPEPGSTIQLTLDRTIQEISETALAARVQETKAKAGVAIVLDVATGRVLALASYPTFDPNSGEGHASARNRPVVDAYEAGSVMKMFSVAAALDDGTVTPETEFDVATPPFPNVHDVHAYKTLDVSGIIKHSSNIGAAKIALRLGREKLSAALRKYGFGARTGIELPGEQPGLMRAGAKWRDVELATISYGYGLTVTPIQVAAGLAAIGNGGVYHAPRIIERITDPDGTVLLEADAPGVQIMKAKTADQMREMLATVMERGKDGGTGKDIVVPGFLVGGKSGTANKWDPVAKKYGDHYFASFVGLAPIEHPRLAIVVMTDDVQTVDHFGGAVSGPVFATIASESLRYLGVPGLDPVCPPPPPGPPVISTAPKTCLPAPAPAVAKKPAPVPAPAPVADDPADDAAPDVGDATAQIPDFRGMGMGKALATAREAHLAIEIRGSGRVVGQEPPPGPAPDGARVTLTFSDESARR